MNPHHHQQQQQQQDDEENDDGNNDNNNNNNNSPCPSCPSFSSYINNTHISEIAFNMSNPDNNDDDFEFDLSGNTSSGSTQVYPVFNRDLLRDLGSNNMIELRKLFFQEDMNNNDDDIDMILSEELEGVSPETYCLWAPKSPEQPSPSRCMKSSSTGSGPSVAVSKTWRLRNLLRRCKSDGKEGLMLVTNGNDKLSPPPRSPGWGGGKEAGVRRRKSYLPYKQELLGFFGSNQTLRNINIPPF